MIEVTTETYEAEVMKSELPVVVKFGAPWCGPCKMLEPMLEELAGELGDKYKFVSVNIDDHSSLAQANAVRGIPTLFVVENGVVKKTKVGIQTKQALLEFLTK